MCAPQTGQKYSSAFVFTCSPQFGQVCIELSFIIFSLFKYARQSLPPRLMEGKECGGSNYRAVNVYRSPSRAPWTMLIQKSSSRGIYRYSLHSCSSPQFLINTLAILFCARVKTGSSFVDVGMLSGFMIILLGLI